MYDEMEQQWELEMNRQPLPFLISIPHGGTNMPPELNGHVIITPHDLFDDSDTFTREIYDVGDAVIKVLKTDIARAYVDLSRAPQQMPPEFPDGLIKSSTCLLKPIYAPDKHPDKILRKLLIAKYYRPYHDELAIWSRFKHIKLGLDCHSMLPVAPDISPDHGQKRPLINLGNLDGAACPNEIVLLLAQSFRFVFNLSDKEVTINRPFKGGYITQKFANDPIPWIQIEMNRILYLESQWFDGEKLEINRNRLVQLNAKFLDTLLMFHKELANADVHF